MSMHRSQALEIRFVCYIMSYLPVCRYGLAVYRITSNDGSGDDLAGTLVVSDEQADR